MEIIENTKRLVRTQKVQLTAEEVTAAVAQFVKGKLNVYAGDKSEAVVVFDTEDYARSGVPCARVTITSEVAEPPTAPPMAPLMPAPWTPPSARA